MTTAVAAAAAARDPWTLATVMATQKVLDDDVVAARRRAWLRRALPVVVGVVAVGLGLLAYDAAIGAEAATAPVRDPSSTLTWSGFALAGVSFVLMLVANVRSSAAGTTVPFVGPADLLPRPERAWVRQRITTGTPVPDNRRAVVAATARRLSDEGKNVLHQVALGCFFVGIAISASILSQLVFFVALAAWTVADMICTERRARRARRWLALNA